jgi:hypothetical protein
MVNDDDDDDDNKVVEKTNDNSLAPWKVLPFGGSYQNLLPDKIET